MWHVSFHYYLFFYGGKVRGRKEQAGGEMDFGNVFLNLVAFNRSVQGVGGDLFK